MLLQTEHHHIPVCFYTVSVIGHIFISWKIQTGCVQGQFVYTVVPDTSEAVQVLSNA